VSGKYGGEFGGVGGVWWGYWFFRVGPGRNGGGRGLGGVFFPQKHNP